jgi:hypothetical protein
MQIGAAQMDCTRQCGGVEAESEEVCFACASCSCQGRESIGKLSEEVGARIPPMVLPLS